jgi:hypothetical protein
METNTAPAPGINVLVGLTLLGVVVLAGFAAVGAIEYHTYTGDDPLIGLSLLLALAAAGTALLGGALTLAGWLVRRSRPSLAQGLAIAGTVIVLLPLLGSGLGVVVPLL